MKTRRPRISIRPSKNNLTVSGSSCVVRSLLSRGRASALFEPFLPETVAAAPAEENAEYI
jgi:hypothetical protein